MSNAVQEVNITPFQNEIIKKSYDKYMVDGPFLSINMAELAELAAKVSMDESEIESQMRELCKYGLSQTGDVYSYRLTWKSLDAFERNYPDKRVYENNKVRHTLLSIAYDHRNNQAGGHILESDVYSDSRAAGISEDLLLANAWYLIESDKVEGELRSGKGFGFRLNDLSLGTDELKRANLFPISANDRVSLDNVFSVVQTWVPRQKRRVEETYKAELSEYLRGHGYPKTREEEGKSNPDILVDDTLPIEMKKDPDQGELDRMSGQILRMLSEFGIVIAYIVQSKPGLDRLERFKKQWQDNDKVRVIVKSI